MSGRVNLRNPPFFEEQSVLKGLAVTGCGLLLGHPQVHQMVCINPVAVVIQAQVNWNPVDLTPFNSCLDWPSLKDWASLIPG
jgi:hypothetical protein